MIKMKQLTFTLMYMCVAVVALTACGGSPAVVVDPRSAPTLTPAPYSAASVPITIDNVIYAQLLGRLDQQGDNSTLNAYSFSPDSTRMAGLTYTQLVLWDLLTGTIVNATDRVG